MTDTNPLGATGEPAAPRSNDPVPPGADLPGAGSTENDRNRPATDADRAEFDAWRARRDEAAANITGAEPARADVTASGGLATPGDRLATGVDTGNPDDPTCPACGASTTNPAWHERLPYCWRCGFGAAAGQDYPVPEPATGADR